MKRELLIPASLALTAHALLALIPLDFMVHASSPSPYLLPLRVSIVLRETLPIAPYTVPLLNAPSHVAQKNTMQTPEKVVDEKPPLTQKKAPSEKIAPKPSLTKKIAPGNTAPPAKREEKSDNSAKQVKTEAEKLFDPESDVADHLKPSAATANSVRSTDQETYIVKQSTLSSKTDLASQHPIKNANGNIGATDGTQRTAAIPPSQEEIKTARERTLAIPRYELNSPPLYPRVARMRGQEGTCLMQVEVLPDGTVGEVTLAQSSGHDVLDKAALQTIKSWRFTPGKQDGKSVVMWVQVPITFRLR